MSHRLLILPLLAVTAFAAMGCQLHNRANEAGFDLPPAPNSATLPYSVSPMRVQYVSDKTYLFTAIKTCFDDEPAAVLPIVATLKRQMAAGELTASDPILLIYHDPTEDPSIPFDLEIGRPIGSVPAMPPPGFAVRRLPGFRCATLLYRGPLKLLGKAYDKLIGDMIARGLVPSEETRESYLVWDEPESSKNVVQIEIGIR
jgi:effector-binding domain-containing protein